MAPRLTLLIPGLLSLDDLDGLERWLRERALEIETLDASWLVWIARMPIFSSRPLRNAHPFRVALYGAPPKLEDFFRQALSWPCEQLLSLSARDDTMQDHLVLGTLAAGLSERFGAMVWFHGELLPGDDRYHTYEERRRHFAQFEGRLEELPFEHEDDQLNIEHVADARFMNVWLHHPHFLLPRNPRSFDLD